MLPYMAGDFLWRTKWITRLKLVVSHCCEKKKKNNRSSREVKASLSQVVIPSYSMHSIKHNTTQNWNFCMKWMRKDNWFTLKNWTWMLVWKCTRQWLHSKVPNGYDLCTLCTCILTIETDINENIMNILNINGKSMHNRSD